MKTTIIVAICALFALSACKSSPTVDDTTTTATGLGAATATSNLLDGKTFTVDVTEADGKVDQDTLVFANGTFDSTACREWGFTPAGYQATQAGETFTFTATAMSPKEGKMTWSGTVTGTQITGSALWEKEGQASSTLTFVSVADTGAAATEPAADEAAAE